MVALKNSNNFPVQYVIYALAVPFDLRFEIGTLFIKNVKL